MGETGLCRLIDEVAADTAELLQAGAPC